MANCLELTHTLMQHAPQVLISKCGSRGSSKIGYASPN